MLFEPVSSRRKLGWQPSWVLIWVAITTIGVVLKPDPSGHGTHQELGLPPCPSALLFDRPCPGCGLTTSWTALLHGNWSFAFKSHPLGPILYLLFTVSAVLAAYGFIKTQKLILDSRPMSAFLGTCAILFFAFGMYRMAVTPHFRTEKEDQILNQVALSQR